MTGYDEERGPQRYVYRWNRKERKGQVCTVTARGTMNSCCVRFEDGFSMVTSRNALRKVEPSGRAYQPHKTCLPHQGFFGESSADRG